MLNLLLLILGAGSTGGGGGGTDDPTSDTVVMLGRVVDLDTTNRGTRPPTGLPYAARNPVAVQIDLATIDADGEVMPYEGASLDVWLSNQANGDAVHSDAIAEVVERGGGVYVATIPGAKISPAVDALLSSPWLVMHEPKGLLVGIRMTRTAPKLARLTI